MLSNVVLPLIGPKDFGDAVYVWIAVLLATGSVAKQIWDVVSKRKQTQEQIDEALDKQPYVREQLALGNLKGAMGGLTVIIDSQAKHIANQDSHITRQDQNIERERARINHLEEQNEALEAEAQGWEHRYMEVMELNERLITKVDNLEAEVIKLRHLLEQERKK